MGCEANGFCASMPEEARARFCAHCRRHLLGVGSIENYVDSQKHTFILLDGFIFGKGYGDDDLGSWPDCNLSRALVITPGYLVGFSGHMRGDQTAMAASSYLLCETDCCIARFDQQFVLDMASRYPEVNEIAARSTFLWSVAMSEYMSLLMAPSLNLKVELFIAFMERHGIYCSEARMAELLGCSRTSVTRACSAIARSNSALFEAYRSNKGRRIELLEPSRETTRDPRARKA